MLEKIQNQIWLFRCRSYDLSSSTAPKAYEAIVKALASKDRKQALAAMRQHIALVRARLIASIDVSSK